MTLIVLVWAVPIRAEDSGEWLTAPPSDRAEVVEGLMEYFGPGPGPEDIVPPEVEVVEERDMGDHVRRTLRYLVEEGEHGEAYLLLPKPLPNAENPVPLALCPHPTHALGKDSVIGNFREPPADEQEAEHRGQRMYALELVRRGFVVFAPDRAAYGARRVVENERSGRRLMEAYREQFFDERWPEWRLTSGKMVWDLQRALDFLLEYDFVDSGNVGIIGHSLGGWDAMMFTAVDERVTAAVANGGGAIDFMPELWTDAEARRRALADPDGSNLNLRRMTNIFLMGIAPRSFLYLRADNDSGETPGPARIREHYPLVVDYYRQAAGNRPVTWHAPVAFYYHSNEHGFEAEARALAYTWLEIQLGMRTPGELIEH